MNKQEYKKPEVTELSFIRDITLGAVIPGPKGATKDEGVGASMTMGSGTTPS